MFFFFKQKTAYDMSISDWSSDVCSSDLIHGELDDRDVHHPDQGEDGGGAIAALAVLEDVQQRHVAQIEEEQDEHRGEATVPIHPGDPHPPTPKLHCRQRTASELASQRRRGAATHITNRMDRDQTNRSAH